MEDLIKRLEEAKIGDRLLDFHIQVAIDDRIWPTRRRDGTIINPNARMSDYLKTFEDVIASDDLDFDFPRYTTSLDAALTLVPGNCYWGLRNGEEPTSIGAWVDPGRDLSKSVWGEFIVEDDEQGKRLAPLALCIAALRAHKRG